MDGQKWAGLPERVNASLGLGPNQKGRRERLAWAAGVIGCCPHLSFSGMEGTEQLVLLGGQRACPWQDEARHEGGLWVGGWGSEVVHGVMLPLHDQGTKKKNFAVSRRERSRAGLASSLVRPAARACLSGHSTLSTSWSYCRTFLPAILFIRYFSFSHCVPRPWLTRWQIHAPRRLWLTSQSDSRWSPSFTFARYLREMPLLYFLLSLIPQAEVG